ncbi:MAG: DUF58 domain-containing protein [Deltaproteobacteria bacterium]|nr:MAG: DUF58 domain-containing protein [Deltaproteobacteria bacterium]
MMDPDVIKKIKKIHIKSRRQVNTLMAGQFKSVFRGAGIEFEEVREYSPGDDVKHIDWKVSARMGRPYVKLYTEERESIVMLLIDMSASNRFGTTGTQKIESAAEIGCTLAFNAIRNNDKVGAVFFTDRVEKYIPPKKGNAHIWRVIKEIFTFTPAHRGTDIREAVEYLSRVSRKRTISFIISDFIDEDFIRSMRIAGRRHEIIAVMLSDPAEFNLPSAGLFSVEDFESGARFTVDASSARVREHFSRLQADLYRDRLMAFQHAGIDCMELRTNGDVVDVLTRYFRLREKRVR